MLLQLGQDLALAAVDHVADAPELQSAPLVVLAHPHYRVRVLGMPLEVYHLRRSQGLALVVQGLGGRV